MVATIIILVILIINLGVNLVKNGKPKDEKYNFWSYLISLLIALALYYYAAYLTVSLNKDKHGIKQLFRGKG